MKITKLKILVASALLFMTASALALQPEVLYAFQLGPINPRSSLVEGSDGNFYGTTANGGSSGAGTVFKLTTNGVLTSLVSFNGANGAYPRAGLVVGSDGNFYGTTSATVFKVTTNGVITTLVSFDGTNGESPYAALVLGNDGAFYGTTLGGGSSGYGTVFKLTTHGVFTTVLSFTGTNGAFPRAGLVQGTDGDFYGTTSRHRPYGVTGPGTVFKVTTNGVLTTLVSFDQDNGWSTEAGLVLGSDGNFYGTTVGCCNNGNGTVFKVTTNGLFTSLVSFNGDNGRRPAAGLVQGWDGNFYGTTEYGGSSDHGTVFRMTTNGLVTTLVSFTGDNGGGPVGGLVLGSNGSFFGTTAGTVFQVTASGLLTTLISFTFGDNGATPYAALVLGNEGNFYGTTVEGGFYNLGTVFKVTTNGVLTSLVSFNSTNGANPYGGLVLGRDGNFYGTTANGGTSGDGTVFQLTANGVLTTLVSFSGSNGAYPQTKLVLGRDGNLYGTTFGGGNNVWGLNRGNGTVFQVTTNGVLTSLVLFTRTNGAHPRTGLVMDSDGNFYGTTTHGGSSDLGTVFNVTPSGLLTTLISFTGANGAYPQAELVQGPEGNFYGTTSQGGSSYTDRNNAGYGTVFRMTTNGVLTTLASFTGPGGAYPRAGLALGKDGYFYGTTSQGGTSFIYQETEGYGTVFRVTTNGVLTSLVSFNHSNSAHPLAGLIQSNDGYFYGATAYGGPGGGGTIFRLVISAFTRVTRQPNGSVLLTGTGPLNGGYRLWASADLSSPLASWTLLTSASFDSNGNFSYTDAGAMTNTSRFYQLSVP